MKKTLGIGVIGLGMGSNVLQINRDPESRLEVRALCDIDQGKLENFGKTWGIENLTTDYKELAERDDIDIVGIYTPDHLHFKHCSAALNAGRHVICTKPMVTSVGDAEKLVRLVDETKLKFLVGQTCRFNLAFMAAKKLCSDGDLGEMIFAEAHYVHDMRSVLDATPWRHQVPQDFMYGGACHPIDLLIWFLGDVEEVFTYGVKSGMDERYTLLEDDFLINLKFKNGRVGRVLAVYGLVEPPIPMLGLGVYGKKGSMVNDKVVFDKIEGKPTLHLNFRLERGHGGEVTRYLRHLEDCIVNDREPLIDVREGAKVIATCSASWNSLRRGIPVKVEPDFSKF